MPFPAGYQVVKNARSASLYWVASQATRPEPGPRLTVLIGSKICKFTVGPIIKPRTVGALPYTWIKITSDLLGSAGDLGLPDRKPKWWFDLTPRT